MTGRRFKLKTTANLTSPLNFLFLAALGAQPVLAQQNKEAPKNPANTFGLNPSATPNLDTRLLESDNLPAPTAAERKKAEDEKLYYEDAPTFLNQKKEWARSAVGAWAFYGNNALSSALFKQSQDQVLLGHSSEKGFGISGFLDFGTPSMIQESLRLGVGLAKFSISPDSDVSSTRLEDSMGIFQVSLLYRFALDSLTGLRTLWAGAGAQMNYVISTSRTGGVAGTASNLSGSVGISPTIAVGLDLPFSSFEDLCFDLEWHPMGGYTAHAGLRTSL